MLENIATAKARGIVLSVLTAGAGYMFYLAIGEPDPAPPPGDAVSVPLVRAEAMDAPPTPLRVIPETPLPGGTAPPAPADRASLARDLQKALAKAQCYDGPITGKWTVASKDAMGAFLVTVNAQLPVDSPDPALLALVTSNDGATCAPKRPLYTGTVTSPATASAAADEHPKLQTEAALVPTPAEQHDEPQASMDDRPMLERAWAPPEMLVPPKDITPSAPVPAPSAVTVSTAEIPTGNETPQTSAPPSITRSASPSPPPASQPVTSNPAAPAAFGTADTIRDAKPSAAPKAEPPPKTAQRKAKAKKRRPSDYDDVSTSITKSWESMQRSLSSIFD